MSYSKLDCPEILAHIFYPQAEAVSPLPPGAKDINIEMEPGVHIGCRFYLTDCDAPSILYFHGNGETVSDHDTIGPQYNEVGINLLVTDYRGYGWSSGHPSVATMFSDGEILLKESRRWLSDNGYTGALFLMGRSLGSACAIDLAEKFSDDIKGLIIESGFADTLPLAQSLGIDLNDLNIAEEDCFNNSAKIAQVTKPTFILHGARDELIPAVEAEKLQSFCGAKSKEFQVVPGADHNSILAVAGKLYFQAIKGFIDKITGASSWRRRRKAAK
ncbi:MAG: alpha/beta hydrolase [Desulfobacteraceae bacterium]|nr:alpha/beta hydrolase [Pseudomonadota bacterium]MCG2742940.1 alpha/beta hydrolase [Desulfobacteraceae bacterium]MDO8945705.1 alpha/beta hydrolase [Desulfocapsaceae bacterium]